MSAHDLLTDTLVDIVRAGAAADHCVALTMAEARVQLEQFVAENTVLRRSNARLCEENARLRVLVAAYRVPRS